MINTRQELEGFLTRVKPFSNPKIQLEQYTTPPLVAATMLWSVLLHGDLQNKTILDLFAGTGILSIGAALLGAKKVIAIEYDKDAIAIFQENLTEFAEEFLNISIIHADVFTIHDMNADIVIMNPPFGVQGKKRDKHYLEKAFTFAPIVYSLFNYSPQNEEYLTKFASSKKYETKNLGVMDLQIPKLFSFHKKHKIVKKTMLLRFKSMTP